MMNILFRGTMAEIKSGSSAYVLFPYVDSPSRKLTIPSGDMARGLPEDARITRSER